jgi:hypothetical protein
MDEREVGANLPWLDYGQDFGASAWRPEGGLAVPQRRERLRRELRRLAESGARLVRLWLLGDGRAGLACDASGSLTGLDARVLPDLDSALAALDEAGLRAMPVLLDFLWFAPARHEGGVQLGGRRGMVRDPEQRARLLEHVFAPIVDHCGRSSVVSAFDLMNEPEWATLGTGTLDPRAALSRREMRAFLSELADLVHERTPQPVCVGLASARWRSLTDGLPLDFEQWHWYESLDSLATLARPVAAPGPGQRAPLLGEFPTQGASLPPERLFEIADAAGYSGALAWSALASDSASDGPACLAALRHAAERAKAARLPAS